MTATIKYAYLKQQTWMFRRNYPRDLQNLFGTQALKQSLKTGDVKLAKSRAAEINAKFEEIVTKGRQGLVDLPEKQRQAVRVAPVSFPAVNPLIGRTTVAELARTYLNKRSGELRHGGFKSVRFSVGLFASTFGARQVGSLNREDGKAFLRLIAKLSPHVRKSEKTRGLGLEQLVAHSVVRGNRITPQTQKRILSQVSHFLDWAMYEGHLADMPFKSIRLDQKIKVASYAAPTNEEVGLLLGAQDPRIGQVMLFCLLSGMRSGEAAGLLREDLINKGNLGWFAFIRPNRVRFLKTDAAERLIPLHLRLMDLLGELPAEGELFPDVTVPVITKGFAKLRSQLGLERPGLVFHSTRKWFITQCERTGVPEHFTASLVGHQSARSENRMTYGIYSAGISDEQKRSIVDGIQLPEAAVR